MFTHDPLASKDTIAVLVRDAQLPAARFFLGRTTLGVPLLQPLIAAITQALKRRSYADLAALEELEVMFAPLAYGRAENLPTGMLDQELGLLGMAALLAA